MKTQRIRAPLTPEQLSKLTDSRLKKYLHSIHRLHETRYYDDDKPNSEIKSKADAKWKILHANVIAELNRRGHIES